MIGLVLASSSLDFLVCLLVHIFSSMGVSCILWVVFLCLTGKKKDLARERLLRSFAC